MKIKLSTGKKALSYVATSDQTHTIELSGAGEAMSPMYAVLSAIAGCSTIDVELILKKMRQHVDRIEVQVEGIRREEIPRMFTKVTLHFIIYGDVKEHKAKQAIAYSVDKYCSVRLMLKDEIEVTYTHEIIPISQD